MTGRPRGRLLAFVIALVLGLSACATSEQPRRPEPLVLAAPPSPSLAPVYVAQAEGYFEDAGLDVQLLEQGVGVLAMSALLAGECDVAAVADPPIARAVIEGKTPRVITTFDRVDGLTYIVARKDRGIETTHDLQGKRIGVVKDNIGHYFLHVYLVTSGIDPSRVEVVHLGSDEMVTAVTSGVVDGISWAPPSTLRAQEVLGDNATVLERPGLYTVTWSFVTMPSDDPQRQDRYARFLQAIDRANSFIQEHPEEAQRITASRADQPLAELQRQWGNHQFDLLLDQTLILTLQDVASWMMGSEGDIPSFLWCVDTGPLREAHPEGVTIVLPEDMQ